VLALWLGGSLARGSADVYSDVDYRLALAPGQLSGWQTPDFATLFASTRVVGQQSLPSGEGSLLFHLLLSNGEIFDVLVQSTSQEPPAEARLVLGWRDEQFAQALASKHPPILRTGQVAQAADIQQLLTAFWTTTHKHCKVLYRNLDLLAHAGVGIEQSLLLRLWYIEISGNDCGDLRKQTIHSQSEIIRIMEQAAGAEIRALVGTPTRQRQEIYRAIEGDRLAVARLGRSLARTYGFAYPEELEATVLRSWQRFLQDQ
jgi:hypothetical protein